MRLYLSHAWKKVQDKMANEKTLTTKSHTFFGFQFKVIPIPFKKSKSKSHTKVYYTLLFGCRQPLFMAVRRN